MPVVAAAAKSLQSCPTLCDPIDGSPPGSAVPGILQARTWSGLPFPSPVQESEKWKRSRSVVSDSSRPHGLQPTRLLRPWDFPGKSTGVGCHCLLWPVVDSQGKQLNAMSFIRTEEVFPLFLFFFFFLFNIVIQQACGRLIYVTLPLIPKIELQQTQENSFPSKEDLRVCSGETCILVNARKWKESSVKRLAEQGVP